jgi:hypothetical protein
MKSNQSLIPLLAMVMPSSLQIESPTECCSDIVVPATCPYCVEYLVDLHSKVAGASPLSIKLVSLARVCYVFHRKEG